MEISQRALRQLTGDVDDQHRVGMTTMASDLRELHAETRALRTRRDVFRRGGFGAAALTIGGAVLPFARLLPAAAQELTDGDVAAFAESVEMAAVEAYKAAAATGKLTAAVVEVGTIFAGHHQEHAQAFGGAAGDKATGKPNAVLLQVVSGQLQGAKDQAGVLQIAYDLENSAAATYLFGLGVLQSEAALKLAASILPVESQHAVVLGAALGKAPADLVPSFENQDKALDPAKFPVS